MILETKYNLLDKVTAIKYGTKITGFVGEIFTDSRSGKVPETVTKKGSMRHIYTGKFMQLEPTENIRYLIQWVDGTVLDADTLRGEIVVESMIEGLVE